MNRDVCGKCFTPYDLCDCFNIFTHARWCQHCKFHVDDKKHHETCEFAALQKEVKELREENYRMREVLMASYAPRSWTREDKKDAS